MTDTTTPRDAAIGLAIVAAMRKDGFDWAFGPDWKSRASQNSLWALGLVVAQAASQPVRDGAPDRTLAELVDAYEDAVFEWARDERVNAAITTLSVGSDHPGIFSRALASRASEKVAKEKRAALLAYRPAPVGDVTEIKQWIEEQIAEQERAASIAANDGLRMTISGRISALSRVRDHLNGIDEYPRAAFAARGATGSAGEGAA